MNLRFLCLLFAGTATLTLASDAVAVRLAQLARKAESSGQTVRAYLLFAEASARDPKSLTYRANRDALAPLAKLLTKAQVQSADITGDIEKARNEAAHGPPPIERISENPEDWTSPLRPVPHVQADPAKHDFNLRMQTPELIEQIASAYGVKALFDSDLKTAGSSPIHFEVQGADFRSALEALTAATHTFVFPISEKAVFFAQDTEIKRNEFEPIIILTFPLQEALTEKDLIDAANAVRGLLNLRTIGWDSASRMVVIRDRVTRAHAAEQLMEALLLPRGQVSFDVQFLAVDTDKTYQYGATLQTLFQFIDFGNIGGLKSVLPAAVGSTKFLTFGGGASLFGVGIADATAFAKYSNSVTNALYDATVVVADKQTASLHIGDKYPIATSIYTGYSQSTASIYNPAPQITMEDLGLVLKISPHINGDGDITIDLEADYKSLGNQTFNTVPSIAERSFKGTVSLREDQWAIIAGIDTTSKSLSRSGIAGLSEIPGIGQIFSNTSRETQTSNTLLVIKPTITRLPMSDTLSPQYLLGPRRGERVLI